MNVIKRYYNELFSLCVFFPLVVFGISSGIITGIGIASLLTLFIVIAFRNYQITAFSVLLLIPTLLFRDVFSFFGTGLVVSSFLTVFIFYVASVLILHKRDWVWMWYIVIWLWGFELFSSVSFDILKNSIIFIAFYSIAYMFFPLFFIPAKAGNQKASMLSLDSHLREDDTTDFDKPFRLRFFTLFFVVFLCELFWVIRVLPLGVLLGSLFITVFFYFFTHIYRGYLLEKPFRYYIRLSTFTFFSLLAILVTAIKKPF